MIKLPITQQAMRFYNRIAYYANEIDDTTAQGSRHLAQMLGDKWVMILENHGALAGGTPLITPAPHVCDERARKAGRMGQYDAKSRDWVASIALVEKHYPDYKE